MENIIERQNPFCVISKDANEHGWRDLQSNSAWSTNPYGDTFAIVPDHMVEDIMKTFGYCDIVLNDEGTEVVSFTATEIPVIESPEPTPTEEELQWQAITDLEISYMELENKVMNA